MCENMKKKKLEEKLNVRREDSGRERKNRERQRKTNTTVGKKHRKLPHTLIKQKIPQKRLKH